MRARREASLECVDVVQRILPAHEDLSCCFGLRQNILSALKERLPHVSVGTSAAEEHAQCAVAS